MEWRISQTMEKILFGFSFYQNNVVHFPDFHFFRSIMAIFFKKFSIQSCCKVKPQHIPYFFCGSSLFFFKLLVHYPVQTASISSGKIVIGRCILQRLVSLFGLIPINLAFTEKLVNFKFVQIFRRCCFSYGSNETQTQNHLIPRRKPNRFLSRNQRCLSLSLLINMIKIFWYLLQRKFLLNIQ